MVSIKNILVLGYYDRKNWGDDVFEYIFENHIFDTDRVQMTITNFDNLSEVCSKFEKTGAKNIYDFVVIGGGDLINSYYLGDANTQLFRKYFSNVPIIFYGVGLSFPSTLPLLDIGDRFWMRNKIDYETVKYRYGSQYSYYTPDIAYLLLDEGILKTFRKTNTSIKKIGVCLPYTWFCHDSGAFKKNMDFFNQITNIITKLSQEYHVHIIPFDTSCNEKNSDLLLIEKFKQTLKPSSSIFYTGSSSLTDTIEYFKTLDFVIGSRFHSVILSILTDTPFISLFSTRKIKVLQTELPTVSELFIELETDDTGIPVKVDEDLFFSTFEKVNINFTVIRDTLCTRKWQLYKAAKSAAKLFKETIANNCEDNYRNRPPQYLSPESKKVLTKQTIHNVLRALRKLNIRNIDKIYDDVPLAQIISKRGGGNSEKHQRAITEEVLWTITGDPFAPYYYGLYENVFSKPLIPQLNWIIEDYYQRFMYKSVNDQMLTLVNKNFQELHRSGWQYIVDNLIIELNNTQSIAKPLILDTYVDKTFHWNSDFYKSKGMIPYKQDWIGFIHHTYSSYNNSYNCQTLFECDLFKESLASCKALIVMSEYLQTQIQHSLKELGIDVDVHVVYHPSELTLTTFDWERFTNTPVKKVVQVGNWMRNVFAIFKLELPKTSIVTEKCVLKNRNSDNYFLPENFLNETLMMSLGNKVPSNVSNVLDICKISFENMHLKGLYECIVDMERSVKVIEYLDNQSYDELLSSCIVFINLVDASAVNTIIECIIRNTPILVNPIGSVTELLGEDYPLYYNDMYEASRLLDNRDLLYYGYEYLIKMDKSKFYITTFVENMKHILKPFIS